MKKMQITYNNETHSIREWAKILHLKENTFRKRVARYGEDNLSKLFSPNRPNTKRYFYDNQLYTLNEIAYILSAKPNTIYRKIKSNKLNSPTTFYFGSTLYTPSTFAKTYKVSRTLIYYYLKLLKSGKIDNATFYEAILSNRKEN